MIAAAIVFLFKIYYFAYIAYMLYLVAASVCSAFIDTEDEGFIPAFIISLSTIVLFAALIYYLVLVLSKKNTKIKTVIFSLIFITCLLLITGSVFYIYYSQGENQRLNFVERLGRGRGIPIVSDHNRVAIDHRLDLRLRNDHELFSNTNLTMSKLWKTVMCESPEKIREYLSDIFGGADIKGEDDFCFNLLWYLCISNNPNGMRLTTRQKATLAELSHDELLRLLPEEYIGARDRASILFYFLSGQYIPEYTNNTDRYKQVINYPHNVVYNLTFGHHQIINNQSIYPPHVYLSQQEQLVCEDIISTINENSDLNKILEETGLIIPGYNEYLYQLPRKEKLKYIQEDISTYEQVFTRSNDYPLPPDLTTIEENNIYRILDNYTNLELVTSYEPRRKWNNRKELFLQIYNDVIGVASWSLVHDFCTNDDSINILSGESKSDIDKNDQEDPTISYGTHKNYRCYQISELEASFREYDGTFMFRRPDWVPGQENREFSIESIQDLQDLIVQHSNNENITLLINKIAEGLRFMTNSELRVSALKSKYAEFTDQQKEIVKMYLSWMFTYSMWMRFWKGPGYKWPVKTNFVERMKSNNRCSSDKRDQHIIIQELVRSRITEAYERDEKLLEWITNLPTIYYNFTNGESSCANYPIKQTLDDIAIGNYCMGFGSDNILKTSYFYLLNILELEQGDEFDMFINNMIPKLSEIELEIVQQELDVMENVGSPKHKIYRERYSMLTNPIKKSYSFDYWNYQNNIHVE